ncbi:MAG: tetratricopeptide repeat protein [Candidatus Omnitrophota bacterium]
MHEPLTLVLEVLKQDNRLKMSLFRQQDISSTLRHYSQCVFSQEETARLCEDIIGVLNRSNAAGELEADSLERIKKTGQLLWEHLLTRTVKERLRSAEGSGLVLSIDEELIKIPWELLYDGRNFLCLNFNLGRLVRTNEQPTAVEYRSCAATLKMLILANPTNDLKSAYLEGINIRNQFDRKRNNIRIDFKSTNIDKLYVKKNFFDYDIVHFAGHCEYDADNPKNSGWILSDGRFTASDILNMAESASLPALVFSNSCHSAKVGLNLVDCDYQQKNYSLASAFLFSGVRHYIGAIRKIEDTFSLSFAKKFYTLLISGKSVGESMRLGRMDLIREHGLSAFPWMSYLLYGDPNYILFRSPAAVTQKQKRFFISKYKKTLAKASLALASAAIIGACLIFWLPSLNPSTYYLFLKSKKLSLQGKNQEAISLSAEIIKKEPLFLQAYPFLADIYNAIGDRENALKSYFDYAFASEKKDDRRNLSSAYTGIGWTYHLQGEYIKAFDFYNKAINLSRENKDRLNEATALRKLAVWHIDKSDYNLALELLMKSAEINRERQAVFAHRYNLACDYFDIGLAFTNKNDFKAAREFYEKSLALFEKLKLKNELSECYFNLGEVYFFEREYPKALGLYMQGLKLDQLLGNNSNLVSDYNMIGELYAEINNFKEAEEFFGRGVALAEELKVEPELAEVAYNLGVLYKQMRKKNKARQYLRQAQEIYSRIDQERYQMVKQEFLALNN